MEIAACETFIEDNDNTIQDGPGQYIWDTWDDREKLLRRQKESFFICQSSLAVKRFIREI